ncbi:MAG: LacI family DNA-binding transcriptional regulator [Fimbriimonas sp.]
MYSSQIKPNRTHRRPTARDVAKLAQVSPTTVSLVMGNKGHLVGISAQTTQRVLEAAKQLAYTPSALMSAILSGRTNIIGVFANDADWRPNNAYWSAVIMWLHRAATQRHQEILLFNDDASRSAEEKEARMRSGIVDGILIQPGQNPESIQKLAKNFPVVCIGDPVAGVKSVSVENERSIATLVDKLVSVGRRRIGHLTLRTEIHAKVSRSKSFLASLGAHGFAPNPDSILSLDTFEHLDQHPGVIDFLRRCDAVICFNDDVAFRVLELCHLRGIRVPEDLAVTGFDGLPGFGMLPGHSVLAELTTIRSPLERMCNTAMDRVVRLAGGEDVENLIEMSGDYFQGNTTPA